MSIVYRSVKGSRLTSDEVDGNFRFLENQVSGGDRFTAFTGFSLAGNVLTLNADSAWVINTVSHTNASSVGITIPYAASGMERIDLIVANASNTFVRVAGVESASNPVAPAIPVNTVQATFVSVTDGTVGADTDPIVGAEFIKKNEYAETVIEDAGDITIGLDSESTAFVLTGAVTSIIGFEMSDVFIASNLYIGKKIKLTNKSGGDIPINHNGTATYPARFPLEVDFVWKNNEAIIFEPVKRDQLVLEFVSVGRDTENDISGKQNTSEKGQPNGYASLDGSGKVPSSQLPSYVDDVIEVANYAALPVTGETGKIYITLDDNNQYRWSGSVYVVFNPGVPTSRTLTINGVTQDLSANRTFLTKAEVLEWFTGDEYSVQATGGALSLYGMATPTTVGSGSNVVANYAGTYTSNPIAFSVHRSSQSGAGAGSSAEFYEATQKLVANELGFVFHGKSGFTWDTGCADYTGLTGSNAATGNVNPSTLLDSILFGADDTDANLQFMHNDGSGTATKHDMGSNFALQSNNAYRFMIWNLYGGNTVNIWLRNLRNGAIFQTSVNTDLPASTVGLAPHLWTGNRGTTNNVAKKFTYFKIQRQY